MLWEKRGCLIDTEKAHIKTGLTSPPANTCLFSHNVMLQLVWRRYAVMSQPQDVLCTLLTRPSPPLSLPPSRPPTLSLSHWDQPTKMSSFRLTDVAVPAHSSAYFMRVTQSVAGVVALMKAPHLLDAQKENSPAVKMRSSWTRGLLWILNTLASHIIDNRVCERNHSHSQTATGNDLYRSRQEEGRKKPLENV